MSIDITRPVSDLRKSALFEQTRPAPENGEGTSWSMSVHEDFAESGNGFWNFWEVGTCYGDVGDICKYCGQELSWMTPAEAAENSITLSGGAAEGFWEADDGTGACDGDDDGNNEGELHVLLDTSDGHPTDATGTCQLEACSQYGDRSDDVEGPMMNYWYPIGDSYDFDPEDAARAIAELPLCVVQVSGDYGLALTGGGMDLTWEIVAAFVTLGYLPPLAHNDPPMTVDTRNLTDEQKYLLAACRESITFAIQRLTNDLDYFNRKWSNA